MKIDNSFIENMDSRKRVNLIHSLSGYSPVVLLGTQNLQGQENLGTFSSLVHLGSHPPLFGLKFRPHTVARHTLENILETKVFSINHVSKDLLDQAHQCSAKYDRNQSEFAATGLRASYKQDFGAPFVEESPIMMAMKYKEHHHIKANHTIFLVAEMVFAEVIANSIDKKGSITLDKMNIITANGLYSYYTTTKIEDKEYATP